ncbi:MAG: preprotein translocase subunit SecA [Dehalococcoidia bacterium]|nr:preprotein translocase subunit SecA [Dehalococcoidia bacterium]
MLKFLGGFLGDPNEREVKKLAPLVAKINAMEPEFSNLTNEQLRAKTAEFKDRLTDGQTLDDLLPEAFAAVREAARRAIGQRHFDVQLMGGIVLHQGKIAEMKTGEGKTLVATLAAYLNSLSGRGVHVITVNDYLAKRDPQWMGPIYHQLGISVTSIQHESAFLFEPEFISEDPRFNHLLPISRKQAYEADLTYGTNNEFGFDHLRDNMVHDLSQCAQRELNYAIVDEVDNVLIDEARTPLIISGAAEEPTDKYYLFARMVPRLREEEDYKQDEKARAVTLTENGIAKLEKWLNLPNLYDAEHYDQTRYLDNALKAQVLYKRDRDYVVKDGQVIIVDEFTGRLMFGRRYSEGLHQAIEAKEGVRIQRESVTMATITFQNYFRMYKKLAGMTGTAATEAEEFHKIYKLEVVIIPTNQPMIRVDQADQVYKNENAKFSAVVREIEELYKQGCPVLVGTISIEKSEHLGGMLMRRGIPHQVLNAKLHEKEASIISQAGQPGMVTIATNMAGRGTDIILGGNPEGMAQELLRKQELEAHKVAPEVWQEALDEVRPHWQENRDKVILASGLHIIGTERHEARRIDNQLRGRAGRQGDPGSSRFYVSLEDDVMRRFGGDRIKGFMEWAGMEEDVPIEHGLVSKAIENAQTKVEGHNFDIRKHLVEYDDVMNKHREVIYEERRKILSGADLKSNITDMIEQEIRGLVNHHLLDEHGDNWDLLSLVSSMKTILPLPSDLDEEQLSLMSKNEIEEELLGLAESLYEEKEKELGPENMRVLERVVMLQIVDRHWVNHLTSMDDLREGIGLRAMAQIDPLVAYKKDAHVMFQELMETIQRDIVHTVYHVGIVKDVPRPAPRPAPRPVPRAITNQNNARVATVKAEKKVGRNDPCPCGSGKKYKKCHGQ